MLALVSAQGADVETRRDIFEQLLPEETFVDRRLMTQARGDRVAVPEANAGNGTQELIAQLEVEQFGCIGDAGPFGADMAEPTFGNPPRTTAMSACDVRMRFMRCPIARLRFMRGGCRVPFQDQAAKREVSAAHRAHPQGRMSRGWTSD